MVPICVKEHGIDYCAECSEFPCKKAQDFFSTINDVIGNDWESGVHGERYKSSRRYYINQGFYPGT